MRTIFIGDVHGCLSELQDLIEVLKVLPDDRVILLGDLINKGPYSAEVVEFVYRSGFECIRGNHDESYRAFFKHSQLRHYFGPMKYQEYRDNMSHSAHSWYTQLPLYIEDDHWVAVHAGLQPEVDIADTPKKVLLNIRTWDYLGVDLDDESNLSWHHFYTGSKRVVYGHWAKQGVHRTPNTLGLDSGCVYGGRLSAYILESDEVVSVAARQQYLSLSK